ncbi:hypothetical protein V7358_14125 [Bacillus pumilus]|uniref:hypothetical protein n=1 Tax=Bacillus pumilus TaxID=1408 RepID=UPI0011A7E844|nr:hypothetical protein [Bacillus pumilus]
MTNKLEELVKLENRLIYICITIATLIVLLSCLAVLHYAATIPSAIVLVGFAADLTLKKYLRRRMKDIDKC